MHKSNSNLIVGGEPPISLSDIFKAHKGQFSKYGDGIKYHKYYTFGAYYSLKAIIIALKLESNDQVLLPSYLCPTIISPFKEAKVSYQFYKVKEGLCPDLDDIYSKITSNTKAILIIDYFGFPSKELVKPLISITNHKNIAIIQDNVQAWVDNEKYFYGDYCFNSMRKISPYEASVILSRKDMKFTCSPGKMNKFILHKRYAQFLRNYHLKYGWFRASSFLSHIEIANSLYHQKAIAALPKINRIMLDKLNFNQLGENRKIVYRMLLQSLNLKPIVMNSDLNYIPLGFAIQVNNRDQIKKELSKKNVYCPIHWKLSEEINKREFEYSWDLQDKELTLPLNIKPNQVPTYLKVLKEVL